MGREADALQEWLEQHPGVEIISRDRARAYSEGASKGAPNAIQVADRWHLLKNMTDAIKRMMNKHNQASRKTAIEIAEKMQKEESAKASTANKPPIKELASQNETPLLSPLSVEKPAPSKGLIKLGKPEYLDVCVQCPIYFIFNKIWQEASVHQ